MFSPDREWHPSFFWLFGTVLDTPPILFIQVSHTLYPQLRQTHPYVLNPSLCSSLLSTSHFQSLWAFPLTSEPTWNSKLSITLISLLKILAEFEFLTRESLICFSMKSRLDVHLYGHFLMRFLHKSQITLLHHLVMLRLLDSSIQIMHSDSLLHSSSLFHVIKLLILIVLLGAWGRALLVSTATAEGQMSWPFSGNQK